MGEYWDMGGVVKGMLQRTHSVKRGSSLRAVKTNCEKEGVRRCVRLEPTSCAKRMLVKYRVE